MLAELTSWAGALWSNGTAVSHRGGPFKDFSASVSYQVVGGGYTYAQGTNSAGDRIDTFVLAGGTGPSSPLSISWGDSTTTVITDPELVAIYRQASCPGRRNFIPSGGEEPRTPAASAAPAATH